MTALDNFLPVCKTVLDACEFGYHPSEEPLDPKRSEWEKRRCRRGALCLSDLFLKGCDLSQVRSSSRTRVLWSRYIRQPLRLLLFPISLFSPYFPLFPSLLVVFKKYQLSEISNKLNVRQSRFPTSSAKWSASRCLNTSIFRFDLRIMCARITTFTHAFLAHFVPFPYLC